VILVTGGLGMIGAHTARALVGRQDGPGRPPLKEGTSAS
jgi:nucleoside-diphosphate-sugar epimerase